VGRSSLSGTRLEFPKCGACPPGDLEALASCAVSDRGGLLLTSRLFCCSLALLKLCEWCNFYFGEFLMRRIPKDEDDSGVNNIC